MGNVRYILSDEPGIIEAGQLLYISNSIYEGEWSSVPHTHFFSEFFYIVEGRGIFVVEGEEFEIKKDDLVIVNPNITHTEKSFLSQPLEYFVLGIRGTKFNFNRKEQNYYIGNVKKDKEDILFYLKRIMFELENKEDNYATIAQNIWEVLLLIIRRLTKVDPFPIEDEKVQKECNQIKRYIDFCYFEDITLDTLSEKTHLNKFYLVHIFTKAYGISPINYLITRRIETSKELLTSTDYSVLQIAQHCGFSSQSYFTQCFKKLQGVSPNQYRKRSKD